jgi:hypothetical protein
VSTHNQLSHAQYLREKQNHATAKAQFDAAVAAGLVQIYRAHKELKPCEANDSLIKKYFGVDEAALETQAITVEDFDLGYEQLKSQLAVWSEQEKRDQIESHIMKLLPYMSKDAKDNLHNQYQAKMPNTFGVFAEKAGGWLVSTESMERKLQNLITGKEHEGMSVEELTTEVKEQRTIGGYPPLPSYATKDQIRAYDSETLKKMMRQYGTAQINAVLAQKG